jgi:hypothetical protein
VAAGVGVVTILVASGLFFLRTRSVAEAAPLQVLAFEVTSPRAVQMHEPTERTVDAYRGLGAWADGFDYSPAYSSTGVPALAPTALNEMAAAGVQTLYLQSGRLDDRSPDLVEDRWLLTEFLMRADQNDIDVVAWYLPKWGDDSVDLDHLMAAQNFEALGYQFDGVAVDIEWNQDGLDPEERNQRLVRLSRLFSIQTGADPIAAIVLPPVQTEIINPAFWPNFPWSDIDNLYDVWLPMSYWSFRGEPYDDGYSYNAESVQMLRENLADPDALVHPIGGIGAQIDAPPSGTEPYIARVDQLDGFAQSLVDTGSIGGSIYDWLTTDADGRAKLAELFETGIAATVGSIGEG